MNCPSGEVSDCNESMAQDILPYKCWGILIFSDNRNTRCGSKCSSFNSNSQFKCNKSNVARCGWTKWVRFAKKIKKQKPPRLHILNT